MKCCFNRYTGGIIIGSIYIVISIIVLIFQSILYVDADQKFKNYEEHKEKVKSEALTSIIICSVAAVISALFIVAIVKRSQYLILPWVILCIYCLYQICANIYWWFVGAAMGGGPIAVLLVLLIGVLGIGIHIAILVFSYHLFRDIHQENKENSAVQISDPMANRSFI